MLEEKTQDLMVNMQAVLPLIVTNALNALGAIVILLIGLWLSGRANLLVVRMLSRTPHFDPTLKSFFGSLARYLILTVTVLAVLSQFGIHTTSLVAVLGAASLAVGLALQGTLSNLAAGVMLLIFRPFRIGHKVQIGGSVGTVKELSLFWTELVTDDKVQIIVPNGGGFRNRVLRRCGKRQIHIEDPWRPRRSLQFGRRRWNEQRRPERGVGQCRVQRVRVLRPRSRPWHS
jgi:small conductance mechanosensitive channel